MVRIEVKEIKFFFAFLEKRKAEDSNPYASNATVFKTAATPIWLAFQMTGTFGFEPKITVLETVGFPINSMSLNK